MGDDGSQFRVNFSYARYSAFSGLVPAQAFIIVVARIARYRDSCDGKVSAGRQYLFPVESFGKNWKRQPAKRRVLPLFLAIGSSVRSAWREWNLLDFRLVD